MVNIIYNIKDEVNCFGDIEVGGFFLYDKKLHQKMYASVSECNAIMSSNGRAYVFGETSKVRSVDVDIVVGGMDKDE